MVPRPAAIGSLRRELPVSLHEQISGQIRLRIATGEWPPHYRLLSEPELAEHFGVSRGTLRRALLTLTRDGVLVQIRGRGTFVTPTVLEPAIMQSLVSLSEDLERQGVEFSTHVIECVRRGIPRNLVAVLGVAGSSKVVSLKRVRRTGQGPVAYLHNVVIDHLVPGLTRHDFRTESLFGVLEGAYGLKIVSGRRTFDAVPATSVVAGELGIDLGAPVQHIQQVTYLADGGPIEYSDVWIRSDRMKLSATLNRR